ncbi:phosphoenolpyruvate synthase [Chitinophaga qingshengii]|uniref:Phosphoenolpyruvate synthase n=1 Tax=Chitinophaga qingshengii TaxID=1569794 RepID=A0ABR7TVX7_9BACT|nr:phosphoenolpyruvate synthase [Chitinophaga qingshengii]MBC9933144.1 phosphoenolpyruvate synthase [Chitinophaga qingshengii]
MTRRHPFVLGFSEIDKTLAGLVGGKGANLGELRKIDGIRVPDGFCITTDAFRSIVKEIPAIDEWLDQLSGLKAEDRDQVARLSGEIRQAIASHVMPQGIREQITSRLEEGKAYAVRSSATAEDLPAASFAGQQDSYLNITGSGSVLRHVSLCWASLFTERAVFYRMQQGFDHRQVQLSVVIQQMVFPQAAGIMFTADPVNGNREVVSIDAGLGLGEAMVSGLVNADNYKVRDGNIIHKKIAVQKSGVYALPSGGTAEQELEPALQQQQKLTDEQMLQLADIGRKIAAHFACPQDIEWCWADNIFYIVQSRPITTLFPIPVTNDLQKHVYLSVGHQQMMTDPIKPLGLSMFLLTTLRPMATAGGRLFVDVAGFLASPAGRERLMMVVGQSEPLINDALNTIIERDFIPLTVEDKEPPVIPAPVVPEGESNPAIVTELIQQTQASIAALKENIQTKSGTAVFDFIAEDLKALQNLLFGKESANVFLSAMGASAWLNEKMYEWLGEKNAADVLSQSVPNNITSEMGLALMDVADVIRPYPEVIHYLQQVKDEDLWEGLRALRGGKETQAALMDYLNKYGMRCVGEIDITKTRWSEMPAILVPMLLSNLRNFEPNASQQKFEQGRTAAMKKEQDLTDRLRQLPDGEQKVADTQRMIRTVRNYIGYREYPKYGKISRYYIYKQALMKEAEQLVRANVIPEKEAVYYLTFEEFREAVRTQQLDIETIRQRKEEYRLFDKLTPPRLMTSEGEIITGRYNRKNIPAEAIVGLPVSAGVVEGRARVVLTMEDANLETGDILVTPFTDPSWTPLFVSIKGLVTEVGGLMTHGAVIAREYGLPAVVSVENATRLIKDGQRIRVHGTEGYIEIL